MSSSKKNQNDFQEQQAKAAAAASRRQGYSALDKGARQLEQYTGQLETTAGQVASNMGQTGMFTFGGPGGRRMGQFRDAGDFGISMAETDAYEIATGTSQEQAEQWTQLGSQISERESNLQSIQSRIQSLQNQLSSSGSSSSRRDRDRGDRRVTQKRTQSGAQVTHYVSDGSSSSSSDDSLSAEERKMIEEQIAALREQVSPIQDEISQMQSQRNEISSGYDGEGGFGDAISRASDLAGGWQDALSEVGDTELSMPQQLRMATGSNLLNISQMRGHMQRDVSNIQNAAMTAADDAFFASQQQTEAADVLGNMADAQRRAETTQNIIGGIAGAGLLIGGTILTGGLLGAAAPAAGIGMMGSGATQLGSSFI